VPGEALGAQPIRYLPTDDREEPTTGVGLCLSGGGYRAMVFHLGALWRLNELGWLPRLDRVSSVSGGSITAGALALAWPALEFDDDGVATRFVERVVVPVRALADHTIDESAIVVGLLTPDRIGQRLSAAYREHLFGDATLQELPPTPRFIINATNLASGALFRFTREEVADWRVGHILSPAITVADAVACSSAFPPVLSPFELDLRDGRWETERGNELRTDGFRGRLRLTDGGVYDNLGLETVWKRCRTVLVSDAGGQMDDDADPPEDWIRQTLRVLSVIDNQVRDLRKRQVQSGFLQKLRDGAYWGIRSDLAHYELGDALEAPYERTLELAETPTRLERLTDARQERLVNWGYAVTDAALRRWVQPGAPPPTGYPYPARGV
jgi:NTE family protein